MSDTELLDLIGHYEWNIIANGGHEWIIIGKFGCVVSTNWRDSLMKAYNAQVQWSIRGKKVQ